MNTKGKHKTLIGLVAVTVMMSSMSAQAALTSVTQDGGLMVSDSTLNVTWADVAPPTGLTWSATAAAGSAQAWVAGLNAENGGAGYGGYNNWTLPTGDGTYTTGYLTHTYGYGASTSATFNQLGYLFINELGNTPGSQATNLAPFTMLTSTAYWSGTPDAVNPGFAWDFFTVDDTQFRDDGAFYFDALAVRSGQVSAVPLPGAAWLMLSGLGGLGLLRRRKQQSIAA